MDSNLANEFLDACNHAFGFLVSDHGFQPATIEVNSRIQFVTVSYTGRNVAVECIFDKNESWVEVKIARVLNGVRPADYAVDSSGRRVRESLYPLLIRRGVRGFGPREKGLSEKPIGEMFRIRLGKDADLLKRHGADIIGDSPDVFPA